MQDREYLRKTATPDWQWLLRRTPDESNIRRLAAINCVESLVVRNPSDLPTLSLVDTDWPGRTQKTLVIRAPAVTSGPGQLLHQALETVLPYLEVCAGPPPHETQLARWLQVDGCPEGGRQRVWLAVAPDQQSWTLLPLASPEQPHTKVELPSLEAMLAWIALHCPYGAGEDCGVDEGSG